MADIADKAQIASSMWIRRQLDTLTRNSMQSDHVSATHYLKCGAPIPESRRRAVPGVQYCVECQKYLEDQR